MTSDRWWAAIRRRHCTAAESLIDQQINIPLYCHVSSKICMHLEVRHGDESIHYHAHIHNNINRLTRYICYNNALGKSTKYS